MDLASLHAPGPLVDVASPARALRTKGGEMTALFSRILSRAARAAPPAEKPQLASLNCAGADAPADAPAASWEAKQEWAANAPRGQKWKRQQALSEFVHELLRQEVGR